MPKGLRATAPAAVVLAVALSAPQQLLAQVYRCESASGVTYSDMPCGASAEQIVVAGDVMDSRGLGASIPAEPVSGQGAQSLTGEPVEAGATDEGEPNLNDFLAMLRAQRQQQIGEIDSQLLQLKQRAASAEFLEMEAGEQDQLNRQIAQLESDRASILSEYDALIAEAERRLE